VVWFGEELQGHALKAANSVLKTADCILVIGTSHQVYPRPRSSRPRLPQARRSSGSTRSIVLFIPYLHYFFIQLPSSGGSLGIFNVCTKLESIM
jgi:hypothetical protein